MNFLKKFSETSISKTEESTDQKPSSEPTAADQQGSNPSDLLSSAKLVADAARSTIQKEEPKHDNAEVAGAGADLLDAAQTYGKLDKTAGVGSYIEKAETYLHDYEASNKPKTTTATPEEPKTEATKTEDAPIQATKEAEEPVKDETKPETEEVQKEEVKEQPTEESAKPNTKDEPKSEIPSGVGEYAKVAEGLVKKEESSEGTDAGGIGEYAKVAEGYLNKQSEGTGESEKSGLGDVTKLAGGFFK